jgi:hypothetical protein
MQRKIGFFNAPLREFRACEKSTATVERPYDRDVARFQNYSVEQPNKNAVEKLKLKIAAPGTGYYP